MAEDTEMQLIEKMKKSKLFALQLDESTDIQNSSILLTCVRYIDRDESDMKEDILSVSELPTQAVKFSKFYMVSLKREVSNGKTVLPVLQVEIRV